MHADTCRESRYAGGLPALIAASLEMWITSVALLFARGGGACRLADFPVNDLDNLVCVGTDHYVRLSIAVTVFNVGNFMKLDSVGQRCADVELHARKFDRFQRLLFDVLLNDRFLFRLDDHVLSNSGRNTGQKQESGRCGGKVYSHDCHIHSSGVENALPRAPGGGLAAKRSRNMIAPTPPPGFSTGTTCLSRVLISLLSSSATNRLKSPTGLVSAICGAFLHCGGE